MDSWLSYLTLLLAKVEAPAMRSRPIPVPYCGLRMLDACPSYRPCGLRFSNTPKNRKLGATKSD